MIEQYVLLRGAYRDSDKFIDEDGKIWVRLETNTFHGKDGPKPPDIRAAIKKRFLDCMSLTNNKGVSCKIAGVSRAGVNYWTLKGFLTKDEIEEAYKKFHERTGRDR